MPSAAQIVKRVRSYGANIVLDGDNLSILNRAKLPAEAIAYVRKHGQAIADFLDAEAAVEERSAIMEHDGGLPRDLADHCAKAMIGGVPNGLSDVDRGYYITMIGRIADEVFKPAYEQARTA